MSTPATVPDIIGRILNARPDQFTPQELAVARTILHTQINVCRPNRPLPPPPDIMLAQILTACPLCDLVKVLSQLIDEHAPPPTSYAYFLTVALQRIHGIKPMRPRP